MLAHIIGRLTLSHERRIGCVAKRRDRQRRVRVSLRLPSSASAQDGSYQEKSSATKWRRPSRNLRPCISSGVRRAQRPLSPQEWCVEAFKVLGDPFVDSYLKVATLEKARNRGCLK
jgi:hypothetical protein